MGREGYRATSVADVITQADVSRTTFYKHFADKHDCFRCAYELAVERVLATVESACDKREPWLRRAQGGLTVLVDLFTAEPELARTAVVEAVAAGAEARAHRQAAIDRLAELLETGRDPCDIGLPANTGRMAVGAVAGLLFEEIQSGRAVDLPDRLPELLFALLVPYLGPERAAEEMHATVTAS